MGSLSLLQRIFTTQELNQGLLQCRQILYQLSYDENALNQGSLHPLLGELEASQILFGPAAERKAHSGEQP